jgi:hypothetical protein
MERDTGPADDAEGAADAQGWTAGTGKPGLA